MNALGKALGAAGLSAGVTLAGWPVVAALAVPFLAAASLACWVLASAARTNRAARIITAARADPKRTQPAEEPDPAPLRRVKSGRSA
jgi:hypothetical protein